MYEFTSHLELLSPDKPVSSYANAMDIINSQVEIERCLYMPIFSNSKGLIISKEDEKLCHELTKLYFRTSFYGNNEKEQAEMGRLGAGTLPIRIIQQFKDRVESEKTGQNKKNIFFYSGHDTTIYSLLSHFGFREWEDAYFAACVILELHQIKGEYFVALKFNHNPTEHTDLRGLRTYKLPIGKGFINMEEAEEGMITLEEFENYLMNDKKSFKNVEEYKNHGKTEE